MKVFVSYKSILWNFKGYEPPIASYENNVIIDIEPDILNQDAIQVIKDALLSKEGGSVEIFIYGITKLDAE